MTRPPIGPLRPATNSGRRRVLAPLLAGALLLVLGASRATSSPDRGAPDAGRLEAAVRRLSGSEFAGAGSASDRERAAAWLAEQLSAASVFPPPGRRAHVVELPAVAHVGLPLGRNVLGFVPGKEAGEHVVLAAPYDSRPATATASYPAADARASGVAAVLEVARRLAAGPRTKRGVLVALLDLSDHGEAGGKALLKDPVAGDARPGGSRPVAAVVAERLGRSLGDAMPGALFVHGAETGTGLASLLRGVSPPRGVTMHALGLDLVPLPTTAALPFEEAGLPTLLVTAGPSRDDGSPRDVAERISFASLAARAAALEAVVRAVADAEEAPRVVEERMPALAEARTLKAVVADLVARADAVGLDFKGRALAEEIVRGIDAAVAKGDVTVGERLAARLLALELFAGLLRGPR